MLKLKLLSLKLVIKGVLLNVFKYSRISSNALDISGNFLSVIQIIVYCLKVKEKNLLMITLICSKKTSMHWHDIFVVVN